MKKIVIFLFAFFLFPIGIFATEYSVADIPVKIDIPDSFDVFTLDNYKGNKQLEKYNVTEEIMKSIFSINTAYMYAYNLENNMEIFVIKKYSSGDFREKDNSAIEEVKKGYISSSEKKNIKIVNSFIQEINGLSFFVVEYSNESVNVVDYVTLLNNQAYIFKFQSVNSFADENREEFKNIMNTVSIDVKEVVITNYLSIVGAVLLILVGVFFVIKRKIDKTKCPICKLKITPEMENCPRCGNKLKNR